MTQPESAPGPALTPEERPSLVDRLRDNWGLILPVLGFIAWIGLNYLAVRHYGPIFLWGYAVAPIWVIVIYLFLDRNMILLIEIALKGDILDEEGQLQTQTTDTKIWKIPPQRWDEMKIVGRVFQAGDKIFICDRYDPETRTVYFPDDSILSNVNFYLRLDLWLDLKERIPRLSRELSRFRWNNQILVEENIVTVLEDLGILRQWIRDPTKRKPLRVRKDPRGEPMEGGPIGGK